MSDLLLKGNFTILKLLACIAGRDELERCPLNWESGLNCPGAGYGGRWGAMASQVMLLSPSELHGGLWPENMTVVLHIVKDFEFRPQL